MRGRVFDPPEVIRLVNDRTVPFPIIYTEDGFPTHLSALRDYATGLTVPWPRLNFAHFVLLDGRGTVVFGNTFANVPEHFLTGRQTYAVLEDLHRILDRYERWVSIARGDPSNPVSNAERNRLARELREVREKSGLLLREPRLWTALILTDFVRDWAGVMALLEPGDRLAPGIRNAAIRALGDLLLNPKPLSSLANRVLNTHLEARKKDTDAPEIAGPFPGVENPAGLPPIIVAKAAEALDPLTAPQFALVRNPVDLHDERCPISIAVVFGGQKLQGVACFRSVDLNLGLLCSGAGCCKRQHRGSDHNAHQSAGHSISSTGPSVAPASPVGPSTGASLFASPARTRVPSASRSTETRNA